VTGPARFVDLDGTVVAGADGGELAAPLDAFAHDVFLLDLDGRNRYAMTRAANLAPLLRLAPTELRVERAGDELSLTNVGAVAAIGLVLDDARPLDAPGWVVFSDNVLDLLPGEERTIAVDGPVGELRVEGWNARG
jgi:beta-mannosidase